MNSRDGLTRRASWGVAAAAAGVLSSPFLLAHLVEQRVRASLTATPAARALHASVERVRFSWLGTLAVEGLQLQPAGRSRVRLRRLLLGWSPLGGLDRVDHVRRAVVEGLELESGGLSLVANRSEWELRPGGGPGGVRRLRARETGSRGDVVLDWSGPRDRRDVTATLRGLDLGSLLGVRWGGQTLAEGGRWSGALRLLGRPEGWASSAVLSATGARLRPPGGNGPGGAPTPVSLAWDLASEGPGRIALRSGRLAVGGAELRGRGELGGAVGPGRVDAGLEGEANLVALLRIAGLDFPEALAGLRGRDLGRARLAVTVAGDLTDLAALEVRPELRFDPPSSRLGAFDHLNGPFTQTMHGEVADVAVDVREGAPGFVPLDAVPELFVRALLLSEDSNFFGHPGVDVAEIPVAWADNLSRGESPRGASTITQQLVKNLFLSREKRYERKLLEAVLALALESEVGKQRILEIYLNVIEWGPGLHGLGPATLHYFGKTPRQLTPREAAFLVCLIPSPVRYHHAHVVGREGPGLRLIVDTLLAKLRSVEAIDEETYLAARAEELRFVPSTLPSGVRCPAGEGGEAAGEGGEAAGEGGEAAGEGLGPDLRPPAGR